MKNAWVTGFLPECVWCPGCEQHLDFCMYVNTWLVLCNCAICSDLCVYSKYVLKWFILSPFDNCVKWYWPTLVWGTLHCFVCRQMCCFTDQENQYSLCLTLGTELHFTSWTVLHYSNVWLEINWHYFQLASILFRSELQQVILAIVYMWISDWYYVPVPSLVTRVYIASMF